MDEEQLMAMQQQGQAPEDAGRGTDTVMAHMSLGEIVIPRAMQDDPEVMQVLQVMFEQYGVNIREFTVGDPANKINPETGYPEFGLFSSLKKIFKVAAPIAGYAIGGPVLGGAIGGVANGGGLKGALLGAGTSALGGQLSNAFGGLGSIFGTAAGTPLTGGVGPTLGSGLTGLVTRTASSLPSIGGALTGSLGGGSSSFGGGNALANAYSAYAGDKANEKARKYQLDATKQSLAALDGFEPADYINSDEYKFALDQGQQGLDRASAARGNFYSGAALQDAAKFNQSLGNQFYNSAYDKFANKTNTQIGLYGNQGDIKANATVNKNNIMNQSLANILGSRVGSANGSTQPQYDEYGRLIGY